MQGDDSREAGRALHAGEDGGDCGVSVTSGKHSGVEVRTQDRVKGVVRQSSELPPQPKCQHVEELAEQKRLTRLRCTARAQGRQPEGDAPWRLWRATYHHLG